MTSSKRMPTVVQASRPVWLGIVVAALLILGETVLVHLLETAQPHNTYGVLYLLAVLVISAGWGVGLAVTTTVVSAIVYVLSHLGPDTDLGSARLRDLLALAVFLPIALLTNALVGRARLRTLDARRAAERVSELAEQQAALRRVATLVARGVSPAMVFTAVADEVANALRVDNAVLVRFVDGNTCEMVAAHDKEHLKEIPVGARYPLDGDNVAAMVLRTGTTARMNSHEHATGPVAEAVRGIGIHSGVGTPIVVDGRLWGAAVIGSPRPEPPAADTEARLGEFAELVAVAIANAEARGQLMASRARIVNSGDEARRRIERDLHDGAQQRLVTMGLRLRSLRDSLSDSDVKRDVAEFADELTAANEELRQLSHGIHPAVLSNGGLRPALRALCRRAATPVELCIDVDSRLPESVEVAAYYVVAEALTNVAKHAGASHVTVNVKTDDSGVRLSVADDGVGGANPLGSGLIGLRDRVEALGGRFDISSPQRGGTTLTAEVPCAVV